MPYKGDAFEIITMINEMFSAKDFKQKNQKVQKFMEEFGNEEVKRFSKEKSPLSHA